MFFKLIQSLLIPAMLTTVFLQEIAFSMDNKKKIIVIKKEKKKIQDENLPSISNQNAIEIFTEQGCMKALEKENYNTINYEQTLNKMKSFHYTGTLNTKSNDTAFSPNVITKVDNIFDDVKKLCSFDKVIKEANNNGDAAVCYFKCNQPIGKCQAKGKNFVNVRTCNFVKLIHKVDQNDHQKYYLLSLYPVRNAN